MDKIPDDVPADSQFMALSAGVIDVTIFPRPWWAWLPLIGKSSGGYEGKVRLPGYGPYYFYLVPMYEKIRRLTGQKIDCYAHARFQGGNLQVLRSVIAQSLSFIQGAAEIDVVVEGRPEKVRMEFVRELLVNLLKMIDAARKRGLAVRFEGD